MKNAGHASYFKTASWVIWIMLITYVLPVYAILLCAIITKGFSNPHFILSMFSSLVVNADDSYSIFHRVLIPLITAFSVVAYRDRTTSLNTLLLIIFILASIVSSIGANLYLASKAAAANLKALESDIFSLNPELAKTFLNHIQELLGTFLMMLLGLKASESVQLREEKA
jgi:hypothetical protein